MNKSATRLIVIIVIVLLVASGAYAYFTIRGLNVYGTNATPAVSGTVTSVGASGDTNAGLKTFTDTNGIFSFSYPGLFMLLGSDAGLTNNWSSGSAQKGLVLAQLTIPRSFQPNTNFADARFTVGMSGDPAAVKGCLTQGNGSMTTAPVSVTLNGVSYARLSFGDAGAGNLYETTSYRTIRNNQCYSVEYTIHSSPIANYPAGHVTAFDRVQVQSVLDSIAQSVRFL